MAEITQKRNPALPDKMPPAAPAQSSAMTLGEWVKELDGMKAARRVAFREDTYTMGDSYPIPCASGVHWGKGE